MGIPAQGAGAARGGAERFPRRCLRAARDLPRRDHSRRPDPDERRVRGHGAGPCPSRRRARAYRRHRSGAGRRKGLLRSRGQCAHAVGRLLCPGEPRSHDAPGAGAVLGHTGAAGRGLFGGASGDAAVGVVQRRCRAQCRAADARPFQQRLFRARFPCRRNGHRTGQGVRPVRRREPRLHAHPARPAAGRRHLSPGRRCLSRSAGDAARLVPGRCRSAGRPARRPGQYR